MNNFIQTTHFELSPQQVDSISTPQNGTPQSHRKPQDNQTDIQRRTDANHSTHPKGPIRSPAINQAKPEPETAKKISNCKAQSLTTHPERLYPHPRATGAVIE